MFWFSMVSGYTLRTTTWCRWKLSAESRVFRSAEDQHHKSEPKLGTHSNFSKLWFHNSYKAYYTPNPQALFVKMKYWANLLSYQTYGCLTSCHVKQVNQFYFMRSLLPCLDEPGKTTFRKLHSVSPELGTGAGGWWGRLTYRTYLLSSREDTPSPFVEGPAASPSHGGGTESHGRQGRCPGHRPIWGTPLTVHMLRFIYPRSLFLLARLTLLITLLFFHFSHLSGTTSECFSPRL